MNTSQLWTIKTHSQAEVTLQLLKTYSLLWDARAISQLPAYITEVQGTRGLTIP